MRLVPVFLGLGALGALVALVVNRSTSTASGASFRAPTGSNTSHALSVSCFRGRTRYVHALRCSALPSSSSRAAPSRPPRTSSLGRSRGVDEVAFDFLYRDRVDSDGDPENDVLSEPLRYSCALTRVTGHRPHVVIEPATASRTVRADGEPVRLEWGDFNARYRVISGERSFATGVLDVPLMAWLVDEAPELPLTWECSETWCSAAHRASIPNSSRACSARPRHLPS